MPLLVVDTKLRVFALTVFFEIGKLSADLNVTCQPSPKNGEAIGKGLLTAQQLWRGLNIRPQLDFLPRSDLRFPRLRQPTVPRGP